MNKRRIGFHIKYIYIFYIKYRAMNKRVCVRYFAWIYYAITRMCACNWKCDAATLLLRVSEANVVPIGSYIWASSTTVKQL